MKNNLILTGLICLCICGGAVFAADGAATERWDRGNALAAAQSVNIDAAVLEMGDVPSLTDAAATLEKLERLETRADWPLPAREAALYAFTRSLAELPRAAVAPEVIRHLQTYQARALVPHEDHGHTLVPLYNIRGAADGVENGWQRNEYAVKGSELLASDPASLVAAYLESSGHNRRAGYLDALREADPADVAAVQRLALQRLEQRPELTPVLGLTAVRTADTATIERLLTNGRGAGLASTLGQLGERLPGSQTEALLNYAVNQAPPANATLAIAAWWPVLKHETSVRDLLLGKLADPDLGSAAALALAQDPDVQTVRILQQTAQGGSLAARRAQLALDINRDQLAGGAQP